MKAPKILKKIDARVVQVLVMAAAAALFIYVFYHQYDLFDRYREVKKSKGQAAANRPVLLPPVFFNFTPDDDLENSERYQLFSFEKKKGTKTRTGEGQEGSGPGAYRVLGVVKKDKWFVLVCFNSDNKIRAYAEGMEIDSRSRVKTITATQVVIADPAGGENLFKIFHEGYITGPGEPGPNTKPAAETGIDPGDDTNGTNDTGKKGKKG